MKHLLLLLAWLAAPAFAAEKITDFHSDIRIARSGELAVTERFTVQVEGAQVKRGILRDFPTDYRDSAGNKVNVPFSVQRVTRNGQPEPYALERLQNGFRVRIGDAGVLLPHGAHTYEVAYRTARQLGFFDEHDELYWNVNGNGWTLPFDRITAEVHLPQAIAASLLRAEAYTGLQGARGRSYASFVRDGGAAFRSTRAFQPREGMTIVVAFPKGLVEQPTRAQRLKWFLNDNRAVGVGIAGALLVFAFLYWRWSLVGRDPRAGPRFPRYEPPPGIGPAGTRYLHRMGFDAGCFGAALLGLGERGTLKIRQSGGNYGLERTATPAAWLPGEKAVVDALLPSPGTRHVIGAAHDPAVQAANAGLAAALQAHFGERLFSRNHGSIVAGAVLAGATALAMHLLEASAAALFAIGGVMALTVLLFRRWMPAYSVEGRKLQDHVEGLRQYMSVAEAEDLKRMKAPPQTKDEFARLLPYAVALDIEKTWAHRFTLILGASAVAAAASHYYGADGGWGDANPVAGMSESLSSLGETISAAATPPGSSSGSSDSGGGGGSSGGGGGGGGGSGW
jgi:uncharacterized membrane protein YgcG